MASNKTLAIIIICFGTVLSVWLLSRNEQVTSISNNNTAPNVISISDTNKGSSEDWKSLLATVNPATQNLLADLSNTDNIPEDTTVTKHLSIDLMSQFLLAKQANGEVNDEEMSRIVNNLLATPSYTEIRGPVYIPSNLHKIGKNDTKTLETYKYNINLVLKVRGAQVTVDPVSILGNIGGPNEKVALANIDSNIMAGRGLIDDFLKIEVPENAVKVHLELMNSVSQLVADVEAMRNMEADPIRSMTGISQYGTDLTVFQNALKKMRVYLAN